MLFPLSIIEPCLEKAGVPIEVPPDWALRTFSFASDDTSSVKADDDQQVLLVVPSDCGCKIARENRTRPLLVLVASDEAQDAAPDDGRAAFSVAATTLSPAAVCAAINRYLVSIREWDAEMSRLVLSNCSTQQLIDLSEEIIEKYVALSDALYARVAATPHFPPLDDMSRALVETGSYPTSMIPTIERLAQSQRWHSQNKSHLDQGGNAINPLPSMSRVYRLGGNYAAHLVMVSSEVIEPWRQFLFDLLANQVGTCLDRFWQTTLPSRDKGAAFLSTIMDDGIHDHYDFKEKARLFDLPIEGVFEIAVITGAEECGGVAHIAHQIRTGLQACRTVIIDQRIYVLMISAKRSSKRIATMEDELFKMVSRLKAKMGLSSRFDMLEYCRMGRMEADVALEYGQKNFSKYLALQASEPYLDCVFRFNRYFPCYLVDPYADTAEFLAKYAASPNLANRLRRADAENGTNDFGLLKVYLYFDCSVKKTADLLNMHRNTVVYRLNKIKNDYRLDLDNCDTRLFLHYLFGVLD